MIRQKNQRLNLRNLWDDKAKNYAKFDGKLNDTGKKFFEILSDFDVEFKGKTLIDIGCGTGIYALYLSKFCSQILGVDSSKNMLEILNTTAKKYEISNVKTLFSDFESLQVKENFDIALCTMSPAISCEKEFEKFTNLAKTKIYLNWEKPRSSTLLEPFLSPYRKEKFQNAVSRCEIYLQEHKIPFKTAKFSEFRVQKRSLDEAVENVMWHMQMNALKVDEKLIRSEISQRYKDEINDEIMANFKLFVF